MKVHTLLWSAQDGWSGCSELSNACQLVIYFGARANIESGARYSELRKAFPSAEIVGASTGGQILRADVDDSRVSALAFQFDNTCIAVAKDVVAEGMSSFMVGERLGRILARSDLTGLFVLSDGLLVNGSELVAGLAEGAGPGVTITGGLAGDGADFSKTVVGANETPSAGQVVAVGFYGDSIRIGHGSAAGWDEFGPQRLITKSMGNVLQELDGTSALSLYERYLADEAEGLPGTALLYPLLLRNPKEPAHAVVRTVLAVDKTAGTMTFAGNLPEGWTAQLMRGHFDRLADAAGDAATQAIGPARAKTSDTAAILVSCIGRRILMGQSIIDEVASAQSALGEDVAVAGFYSYGEIAPQAVSGRCELHNQTMTVTTISEA